MTADEAALTDKQGDVHLFNGEVIIELRNTAIQNQGVIFKALCHRCLEESLHIFNCQWVTVKGIHYGSLAFERLSLMVYPDINIVFCLPALKQFFSTLNDVVFCCKQ